MATRAWQCTELPRLQWNSVHLTCVRILRVNTLHSQLPQVRSAARWPRVSRRGGQAFHQPIVSGPGATGTPCRAPAGSRLRSAPAHARWLGSGPKGGSSRGIRTAPRSRGPVALPRLRWAPEAGTVSEAAPMSSWAAWAEAPAVRRSRRLPFRERRRPLRRRVHQRREVAPASGTSSSPPRRTACGTPPAPPPRPCPRRYTQRPPSR